MERYLKHPPREPEYRLKRPHRDFVIGLKELGLVEDIYTIATGLEAKLALTSLWGVIHY